jgi:putative ABC transport system permease protein
MNRPIRTLRRGIAAVALILRRLRVQRVAAAALAALVLITAFVFAAVPRLYNRMSDDGLRYQMRTAPAPVVNLAVLEQRAPAVASSDALDVVDAEGSSFITNLPIPLQQLIGDRQMAIDSTEFSTQLVSAKQPLDYPLYLKLRHQTGLASHIRITDGRLPGAPGSVLARPGWLPVPGVSLPGGALVELPLVEVAVSRETAGSDRLTVGQRFVAHVTREPPTRRFNQQPEPGAGYAVVDIVGVFDVVDPDAAFWYGDVNLQRPTITGTADAQQVHATALMAPESYAALADRSVVFSYEWRYFFNPDSVDAGELTVLSDAVRRVKADYPAFLGAQGSGTAVRTGLDTVLTAFVNQRRLSEAILAVVTIGLAAMAAVVIGLLAALMGDRRRAATVLQRGRGASAGQIIGGQVAEALLLGVPSAAVGLLGATLLIPSRDTSAAPVAAALVALAVAVLMTAAALPYARRTLGQLERNEVSLARVNPRRRIFEGLVVVLAVIGIVLLRRRGLTAAGAGSEASGFDPFLAAVPVLLGVAVGLVVLRLYPLPVRIVAWLASLGRGFVTVFALRRVGREAGAVHLPLLVLLLTIAIGVFSSVVMSSIERGQVVTAWQQVGAPYRAEAAVYGTLPNDLDLSQVDGVRGAARAYILPDVTFDMQGTASGSAVLDAVDVDGLARVTAGTPADPHLPLPLVAEAPRDAAVGSDAAPIMAVVSKRAPLGSHVMSRGDRFELLVDGAWTSFEVAEARDTFPGIAPGRAFVVVSLEHLQASRPTRPLPITTVFLAADPSAEGAIRAALPAGGAPPHLASQSAVLADLHASPLVGAVSAGFGLGLLVAALYSALAVVVALILTAAARSRDLTFLRTLGLTGRQSIGLTVVEHLPSVLLAVLIGIGLGVGLAVLLEPGLDLRAFAGQTILVPLSVDWIAVGVLALALATVVAAAVLATAALARRMSVSRALRLGDD